MACECFVIGGPFIAEDPDCEVHGVDGYAARLEQAEARIAELEDAIRDEVIRSQIVSLPRKLEFMRQRGMRDLDEVHAWMFAVGKRLKDLVDG